MTNEEKAKKIYKDNLYDCEIRGVAQDEQEILFMLEKMAQWKDDRFYTILACIKYSLENSKVDGVDEFINNIKKEWEK